MALPMMTYSEKQRENRLLALALTYEQGHSRRSRHILSVLRLTQLIADGEEVKGEEREALLAAAILHDIPIRYCKEAYGDACQENQRREAVRMVPEFLQKAGYPPQTAQQVLPLVLGHHRYEETPGPLLQILMEADLLVNLLEGEPVSAKFARGFFKTQEGKVLLEAIGGQT